MKTRLFNRGKGWYVSATNWKDNQDKAYMNVRFVKCAEPMYHNTEKGYDIIDIVVTEGKYECYQNKISLTVFNYELPKESVKTDIRPSDVNDFDDDDLPF